MIYELFHDSILHNHEVDVVYEEIRLEKCMELKRILNQLLIYRHKKRRTSYDALKSYEREDAHNRVRNSIQYFIKKEKV